MVLPRATATALLETIESSMTMYADGSCPFDKAETLAMVLNSKSGPWSGPRLVEYSPVQQGLMQAGLVRKFAASDATCPERSSMVPKSVRRDT